MVGARVNSRLGLWPVNRPASFTPRFSGEGPSRGFSREQRGRRG